MNVIEVFVDFVIAAVTLDGELVAVSALTRDVITPCCNVPVDHLRESLLRTVPVVRVQSPDKIERVDAVVGCRATERLTHETHQGWVEILSPLLKVRVVRRRKVVGNRATNVFRCTI